MAFQCRFCCPTFPFCRRGSNAAAPSIRRQNYIVEQGHFAASPTTLIGEGGWRSQLYRFLGLLRSPPLSCMSLISLHLCQATVRTSGCGINFARRVRPDRNERPSGEMAARREKEAACQIDCTEGGEERGKSGRSLGSLHLCRACSAPT